MIEQLSCFWSQRKEARLIALPAHANLCFRQQQIVAIQIHDFLGTKSLQQHQSHDGEIPGGTKTRPKPRYLIHRQWRYGSFRGLHPQAAQGDLRPAKPHWRTLPIGLLESGSNLLRSIREQVAQGFIDDSNALVNGAAGQRTWQTGLKSHIVEQRRFRECFFGDRVGVTNTLPPTEKVQ